MPSRIRLAMSLANRVMIWCFKTPLCASRLSLIYSTTKQPMSFEHAGKKTDEVLGKAADKTKEVAHNVAEKTKEVAHNVAEGAKNAKDKVVDKAVDIKEAIVKWYHSSTCFPSKSSDIH